MTELFTEAFADLFGVARTVARRIVGSAAVAEDVAAEAMARAFVAWDRIGDSSAYRTGWTLRVATNLAIDAMRRKDVTVVPATAEFEDQAVLRIAVAEALRDLPQRQREVVVLRHFAGLSQVETADALAISRGSVATHTSRALAALRERLGDTETIGGKVMQVRQIEEAAALVGTNRLLEALVIGDDEHVKSATKVDIGIPALLTFRGSTRSPRPAAGDVIDVVVIDVVPEEGKVLVARPVPASEAQAHEDRARIIGRLQPGDRLQGRVSSITAFGAFVDIFTVRGLVHVSEMGEGVTDPAQAVQAFQEVEVEVLATDVPLQRMSFRLVQQDRANS